MNVPAFANVTLRLGRTFNAQTSAPGIDLFDEVVKRQPPDHVNKFSFQYKVIKNSQDVRDLLDISGELSLKIKANLLSVEGSGKYLNDSTRKEGTTELLAVMKCSTVMETIDSGKSKVNEGVAALAAESLGSHYVRSVIYGAEMVASLKFKSSSTTSRENIQGKAEGKLKLTAVDAGLKAQLDKLSTECSDVTDIEINYYATDHPDKLPTSLGDLVKLIETFPDRMKEINRGQGVPIEFELQPLQSLGITGQLYLKKQALLATMDDIEARFDDLLLCQSQLKDFIEDDGEETEEVSDLADEVDEVLRTFRGTIARLDMGGEEEQLEGCYKAYKSALDGKGRVGKFMARWRKITKTLPKVAKLKLPVGKSITSVLFGKTGNGKSSTANQIVGKRVFKQSGVASSVTQSCQFGKRNENDRVIEVIDTPGLLDTSVIKELDSKVSYLKGYTENTKMILKEVSKVFRMAPDGIDAILLVVKFGTRLTLEDSQALKMLVGFLGEDAKHRMVLIFTYADQAILEAEDEGITTDAYVAHWMRSLPLWVQQFITDIGDRVVLFNNRLNAEKEPDAQLRQVANLVEMIDRMVKGKKPYVNKLTLASKEYLNAQIKKAMDATGLTKELEEAERRKKELEKEMKEKERCSRLEQERLNKEIAEKDRLREEMSRKSEKERKLKAAEEKKLKREYEELKRKREKDKEEAERKRKELEKKLKEQEQERKRLEEEKEKVEENAKNDQQGGDESDDDDDDDGCFPGSASFVDMYGKQRKMKSLEIGDDVEVLGHTGEVVLDTVIAFIHRQPDKVQDFVKLTTKKGKVLKITEDHLLFVDINGKPTAIPSRDVSIGDVLFVAENGHMMNDTVQSIGICFEKGVFSPVTLTGSILVNDVHTSCYFDVLSHSASQMAMSGVRAMYYISPKTLEWISGVGEKDGFPGWCRLAHKALTFSPTSFLGM